MKAGKAGVVPRFSQDETRFPGGQYLVEMEHLDRIRQVAGFEISAAHDRTTTTARSHFEFVCISNCM